MDLKDLLQVIVLSVIQVVPDLVDISIQVSNSVNTINEMDIDIFVEPPFEPTTTTYIEPTTTTTYLEPTTTTTYLEPTTTTTEIGFVYNIFKPITLYFIQFFHKIAKIFI